MKYISAVFLFSFLFTIGYAQKETVNLRSSQVAIFFKVKDSSNFENINGKVNVSIISSNGLVLEINGIDEKKIVCNSKLSAKDFKIVLIDELKGRTFISYAKPVQTVSLSCDSNNKYELKLFSWVVWKGKKIIISATLFGKMPRKEYMKTN